MGDSVPCVSSSLVGGPAQCYSSGQQSQSHAAMGDDAQAKKAELNSQLKDYILQWRDERSKEEEELKRLKEKQAKRKEIRAEQKRAEELALKKEEEARRKVIQRPPRVRRKRL